VALEESAAECLHVLQGAVVVEAGGPGGVGGGVDLLNDVIEDTGGGGSHKEGDCAEENTSMKGKAVLKCAVVR
jgi:hypothetical protein